MKTEKYLPTIIKKTIYDIDFDTLYKNGKRYLIFDIDNTLIPYDKAIATTKVHELIAMLQSQGFTIILMSNNKKYRVRKVAEDLDVKGFSWSLKPWQTGFKKVLKHLGNPPKAEVITIGDQIMTDIRGANKAGLDSVLVMPIKSKTEKWYTKLNRHIEKKIIKEIEVKNKLIYKELIEKHEY